MSFSNALFVRGEFRLKQRDRREDRRLTLRRRIQIRDDDENEEGGDTEEDTENEDEGNDSRTPSPSTRTRISTSAQLLPPTVILPSSIAISTTKASFIALTSTSSALKMPTTSKLPIPVLTPLITATRASTTPFMTLSTVPRITSTPSSRSTSRSGFSSVAVATTVPPIPQADLDRGRPTGTYREEQEFVTSVSKSSLITTSAGERYTAGPGIASAKQAPDIDIGEDSAKGIVGGVVGAIVGTIALLLLAFLIHRKWFSSSSSSPIRLPFTREKFRPSETMNQQEARAYEGRSMWGDNATTRMGSNDRDSVSSLTSMPRAFILGNEKPSNLNSTSIFNSKGKTGIAKGNQKAGPLGGLVGWGMKGGFGGRKQSEKTLSGVISEDGIERQERLARVRTDILAERELGMGVQLGTLKRGELAALRNQETNSLQEKEYDEKNPFDDGDADHGEDRGREDETEVPRQLQIIDKSQNKIVVLRDRKERDTRGVSMVESEASSVPRWRSNDSWVGDQTRRLDLDFGDRDEEWEKVKDGVDWGQVKENVIKEKERMKRRKVEVEEEEENERGRRRVRD